jgi:predicted RNase H-like HicB family nuclease
MEKVRYTVVLEWDPEEELYIATIPALSVGSYGETREEAMAKIEEAAIVTIGGLKATGQTIPMDDRDTVGFVDVAV